MIMWKQKRMGENMFERDNPLTVFSLWEIEEWKWE